jgi:hypothetical protein
LFLFGWLPTITLANGSLPIQVHFRQSWPTHGHTKPWPKFWLAKYLVRQSWDQTKHTLDLLNLPNIFEISVELSLLLALMGLPVGLI